MNDLELTPGFFATADRYLWHPATATAILADLHLGAEAELTRRGMFMPDVSTAPLQAAWSRLCDRLTKTSRGHVIIAGDLFDVPNPDPHSIALATELFQSLPAQVAITLLPGNHDPAPATLRELFPNLPITVAEHTSVGGYLITHGHQIEKPISHSGLIVGHQHPAVILKDRIQSAKMICFATANIPQSKIELQKSKIPLILLPAFSRAPLGSNLLTGHNWILDLPRPSDANVRIAGIVEPSNLVRDPSGPSPARVLDFGPLEALRLPF